MQQWIGIFFLRTGQGSSILSTEEADMLKVKSPTEAVIKVSSLWGESVRYQHFFNRAPNDFIVFREGILGFDSKALAQSGARALDAYANSNRRTRPKGLVLFSRQGDDYVASDGVDFLSEWQVARLNK